MFLCSRFLCIPVSDAGAETREVADPPPVGSPGLAGEGSASLAALPGLRLGLGLGGRQRARGGERKRGGEPEHGAKDEPCAPATHLVFPA